MGVAKAPSGSLACSSQVQELERPRTAGEQRSRSMEEGDEELQGPVKEAAMTPPRAQFYGENARPLTAAGRDTSDGSNKRMFRARERPTLAIVGKHLGSSASSGTFLDQSEHNLAQPLQS